MSVGICVPKPPQNVYAGAGGCSGGGGMANSMDAVRDCTPDWVPVSPSSYAGNSMGISENGTADFCTKMEVNQRSLGSLEVKKRGTYPAK